MIDTGIVVTTYINSQSKYTRTMLCYTYTGNIMAKTGYEIRLNILEMARGHLMDGFHSELQKWSETRTRDDKGMIINSKDYPSFPKVSDILEKASELYKFVELQ